MSFVNPGMIIFNKAIPAGNIYLKGRVSFIDGFWTCLFKNSNIHL